MTVGKVWLVGAGPGDPELLTLKAVRVMGQADIVLVDDLVNPEILQHVAQHATIIPVGKRGGCRSTPQAFIERLMIRSARKGACVVRLKGGDPLIFGRGGEEITALNAAGIPCEVINGLTAGIAVPSTLGISLTQRDISQGVVMITGHSHNDDSIPWAELARSQLTLVIYMGLIRCQHIVDALIAGGLAPNTPTVAVQNATRTDQRHITSTLLNLPQTLLEHHVKSPAILIIGKVTADLQDSLTTQQLATG